MAEPNRIIQIDQRNKACPKCTHGVLKVNEYAYHRDKVKCDDSGHMEYRYVEFTVNSPELPEEPSRYRKIMNFIVRNKCTMQSVDTGMLPRI